MYTFEVLNAIIAKKGYKKYLEIGIDDPEECFNKLKIENKTGVDPYVDEDKFKGVHTWKQNPDSDYDSEKLIPKIQGKFHRLTSDEYFKKHLRNTFDIIFIDGLHTEEQSGRDIENSLKRLMPGGLVVVHDTIPKNLHEAVPYPVPEQPWCGEVYRSIWKLRTDREDLDIFTWAFNTGTTFIRPGVNVKYYDRNFPNLQMSFQYLEMYKDELLNVKSWQWIINHI